MATFNFYLKDVKSEKETAVFLYVRWKNRLLKQYFGESINPKYWEVEKQRAKQTKSFPEYPEFNFRLEHVEKTAKNTYRQYLNDHENKQPGVSELKKNLREALNIDERSNKEFMAFFQQYIDEGEPIKSEKTTRYYKNTLVQLKGYQTKVKTKLEYANIDMSFYNGFIAFLQDQEFATNTIGKHIQNLKAVLSDAEARGMKVNPAYRLKGFKKPVEESLNIYLNEEELQAMQNLDLSDNSRLEKVRDLFLVGCWTGLRYSDFSNIQKDNIKDGFLTIKQAKTKEPVVIPLHPVVDQIRKKYKHEHNGLPPAISDQKMRQYLQEIGKKIPALKEPYLKSITKGGKQLTERKLKYEMLGTHTARRSFATNMYNQGLDTLVIRTITGHKTEKAFFKYIKTSAMDKALKMKEHIDKQQELKLNAV